MRRETLSSAMRWFGPTEGPTVGSLDAEVLCGIAERQCRHHPVGGTEGTGSSGHTGAVAARVSFGRWSLGRGLGPLALHQDTPRLFDACPLFLLTIFLILYIQ